MLPQLKTAVTSEFAMMKISVIVPAYDEEQYLLETLERIGKALSIAECPSEIIVVDNESNDETKRIAESFGEKVLLEIEHNIAKVRNTGAKNSNGEFLIFIDADTHVPETLFKKITSLMEDGMCFGGAVAVEYRDFERKRMKYYFLGWKFWGTVFNMMHGAGQFMSRSLFDLI